MLLHERDLRMGGLSSCHKVLLWRFASIDGGVLLLKASGDVIVTEGTDKGEEGVAVSAELQGRVLLSSEEIVWEWT